MSVSKIPTERYRICLFGISKFKLGEITFSEMVDHILPSSGDIAEYYKYTGNADDFYYNVDAWAEMILYCYPEDMQRELGLKFANFFEDVILNQRIGFSLPKDDPVLQNLKLV